MAPILFLWLYKRRHRFLLQDLCQLSVCLSVCHFCLSVCKNFLFYSYEQSLNLKNVRSCLHIVIVQNMKRVFNRSIYCRVGRGGKFGTTFMVNINISIFRKYRQSHLTRPGFYSFDISITKEQIS